MSATLSTNFLFGNLYTATVADNTFITDTLVLTAMALVILSRTENALAEQTIALGFVGTIVDGLRLQNLTIRIFKDLLGRCQSDGNFREISLYFIIISLKSHSCILYMYPLIESYTQT